MALVNLNNKLNVETFGQVFTQDHTVDFILGFRKNKGSTLEPSCGAGAISNKIQNCIAIELDENVKPAYALHMDFFEFEITNKFNSIVGNPPFVKYKDFSNLTKKLIENNHYNKLFDERSNLYLFFIYKCILHLEDGGELIFINPREFLKATSAIKLNNYLFEQGTITDIVDLGDARLFGNFTPNCVIWRFEKGNRSKKTNYATASLIDNKIILNSQEEREFKNTNGQLMFVKTKCTVPFKDLFYVKVGGVSGADKLFANAKGNKKFVNSKTVSTGKTKKFFYNIEAEELLPHKKTLLNRKIKKFDKNTWYFWGRNVYVSDEKRIYVNCKTRQKDPFFHHKCKNYDGSVLGIFPIDQDLDLVRVINDLNGVDWEELGFVCDGRFMFSQKALQNCILPSNFEKYKKKTNKLISKNAQRVSSIKENKMSKKKNVWVSPRSDGWAIKKEGNEKASLVVSTQKEAIKIARQQAINEKSELIVQRPNGKIRQKDSFGNDHNPPKDKN